MQQAYIIMLPDLGHGPNKPTVTIIGEYSASYHDAALISQCGVHGARISELNKGKSRSRFRRNLVSPHLGLRPCILMPWR